MNHYQLFQNWLNNKELEVQSIYDGQAGNTWSPVTDTFFTDTFFTDLLSQYSFRLKPKPPRFKVLFCDGEGGDIQVSECYYESLEDFKPAEPYKALQILTSLREQ